MGVIMNCKLDYFCNNGDCACFSPTIDENRYYQDGMQILEVNASCKNLNLCSRLTDSIIKNLKANEEIAF